MKGTRTVVALAGIAIVLGSGGAAAVVAAAPAADAAVAATATGSTPTCTWTYPADQGTPSGDVCIASGTYQVTDTESWTSLYIEPGAMLLVEDPATSGACASPASLTVSGDALVAATAALQVGPTAAGCDAQTTDVEGSLTNEGKVILAGYSDLTAGTDFSDQSASASTDPATGGQTELAIGSVLTAGELDHDAGVLAGDGTIDAPVSVGAAVVGDGTELPTSAAGGLGGLARGPLTVDGSLNLSNSSVVTTLDDAPAASPPHCSAVDVDGSAALAGSLEADLETLPVPGTCAVVTATGGVTGSFAKLLTAPDLGAGASFDGGILSIAPYPVEVNVTNAATPRPFGIDVPFKLSVTPTSAERAWALPDPSGTVSVWLAGNELCHLDLPLKPAENCDAGSLPLGTKGVTVEYSGDSTWAPVTEEVAVTVPRGPSSERIVGSPPADVYVGVAVHNGGALPPLTGTVAIATGSTTLCRGRLDGTIPSADVASCTPTRRDMPVGNRVGARMSYSGNTDYAPSRTALTFDVLAPLRSSTRLNGPTGTLRQGARAVLVSRSLAVAGANYTDGQVRFTVDGRTLCTATISADHARCVTTALPAGHDRVVATFLGSYRFDNGNDAAGRPFVKPRWVDASGGSFVVTVQAR